MATLASTNCSANLRQRAMAGRARTTIREVAGSHAVYVADPKSVAALIEEAATSSKAVLGITYIL